MTSYLLIFLGGGLGSVLRFFISGSTQKWLSVGAFPMGTLVVNLLGCFLMGWLLALMPEPNSETKTLLTTGFCGGFTTFSLFSVEGLTLWQTGAYGLLIAYLLLSVFGGILAVYLGFLMK